MSLVHEDRKQALAESDYFHFTASESHPEWRLPLVSASLTLPQLKYKRICGVPDTAERTPSQMGEQERRRESEAEWFLIGYRWTDGVISQ